MSNFDHSFFKKNRDKLFSEILPESVVVLFSAEQFPKNGDQYFNYRQNSDTYYFSGLTQEDSNILLYKGKNTSDFEEFAFIIESNQKMITWIGHKYSKTEAANISDIKTIEFNDKLDTVFENLIKKSKHLYFSHKSNVRGIKYEHNALKNWLNSFRDKIQNIDLKDLDPHSMKLRLNKTSKEIEVMQKAINITGETFHDVLKYLKPEVYEYQVEAEILRGFMSRGAQDAAYASIVAAGDNNNILHYCTNRNQCHDGQLLLMDFGAELDYYAADITRTIPVSGKFTNRQKEVYNAVLDVQKQMKNKIVQGKTIRELNSDCEILIQEQLLKLNLLTQTDINSQNDDLPALKKYYMHGVSHFIGLDVHDTGKKDVVLEPGMILSCEPGIYIKEESFGIRLENDILVGENKPIDLCEHIPIEADEIEELMKA